MKMPVVIVTGASRGIGAAAARAAARLGASVALAGRTQAALQQAAVEIETAGGQALPIAADVGQEADCRAVITAVLARFGRIDALINNAGTIGPIGPLAEVETTEWMRNWAVNLFAPVLLTKLALPALRQSAEEGVGGRVIHITSGAAENPIAGWGAYTTAKAALNQFTRVLAAEEPALTVLAVRPGTVDTEMQKTIRAAGRGRMGEQNYQWLTGLYAQGRLLPPDAPGKAIAVLALHAPREWSGAITAWDEARVQELAQRYE